MPFFTILTHLGAATYAGSKIISESAGRRKAQAKTNLGKHFHAMYTDPELEAELKAKIEDPKNYDWVWERIEAYKRNRGKYYLWRHSCEYWSYVGHKRTDFFSHGRTGSLYVRNQDESLRLLINREEALEMLLNTYGRMRKRGAERLTMYSTYDEVFRYIKQHPADAFLGDTTTALDEAPLEGVTMPDGWPEDHRPPNEVPRELRAVY